MEHAYRILNANVGFFCVAFCVSLFSLYACDGSGSSDETDSRNGSVGFILQWVDNASALIPITTNLHSGDVCADYGIELIGADIFNAFNTVVSSDSWPCLDNQGKLDDIPAGTGA